jgi:hypothetical protein
VDALKDIVKFVKKPKAHPLLFHTPLFSNPRCTRSRLGVPAHVRVPMMAGAYLKE